MKNPIRLIAFVCVTLATSTLCRANWYNHPICTSQGLFSILKWHSTYHDFNGGDFTSSDAPGGMTIPAANLRGITDRASLILDSHGHNTHKRGGSFPVWQGVNHTSIRGWINVTVTYANNNETIVSHTWTYDSTAKYDVKTW